MDSLSRACYVALVQKRLKGEQEDSIGDFRKSFIKMIGLVGKFHEAAVRIVADTDGSGLELVRQLELY